MGTRVSLTFRSTNNFQIDFSLCVWQGVAGWGSWADVETAVLRTKVQNPGWWMLPSFLHVCRWLRNGERHISKHYKSAVSLSQQWSGWLLRTGVALASQESGRGSAHSDVRKCRGVTWKQSLGTYWSLHWVHDVQKHYIQYKVSRVHSILRPVLSALPASFPFILTSNVTGGYYYLHLQVSLLELLEEN